MANTSDTFNIGWIVLLIISALALLNHLMLPLYDKNNLVVAIGWVPFSLYATLVLAVPFWRGERWAWYTSWIQVIVFASLILFKGDPEMRGVVTAYFIGACVMALCLLVTWPSFFRRE